MSAPLNSASLDSALLIPGAGQPMLGVLSLPAQPASTAVLILVGGPQYRAGSHRQFVHLARHLAGAGFATLRFDFHGMGDSVASEPAHFEALQADIGAAVDSLIAAGQGRIDKVVLWGLCDGASAALLYWHASRDPRIAGMALLNPWVRSTASLARAQVKHYYTQRLREREFWLKLLRGQVAAGALSGLLRSAKLAWRGQAATAPAADNPLPPFQQRMASACAEFPGALLLVLSGRDLTAQEFIEHSKTDAVWRRALQGARLQRHDLPLADHTFSEPDASRELEALTARWLIAQPPSKGLTAPASLLQETL